MLISSKSRGVGFRLIQFLKTGFCAYWKVYSRKMMVPSSVCAMGIRRRKVGAYVASFKKLPSEAGSLKCSWGVALSSIAAWPKLDRSVMDICLHIAQMSSGQIQKQSRSKSSLGFSWYNIPKWGKSSALTLIQYGLAYILGDFFHQLIWSPCCLFFSTRIVIPRRFLLQTATLSPYRYVEHLNISLRSNLPMHSLPTLS
jgi:hypothetical protein